MKLMRAILKDHTSFFKGSMVFCLFILLKLLPAEAQVKTVSLGSCRDSAYHNYPLIRKYDLIRKSEAYSLSNIKKGYLPQGTLGAQATWQSEVTSLPVTLPGIPIPRLNKDQYKVQLELTQLIYDGGRIRSQADIVRKSREVDVNDWKVQMYEVYARVDELYFGILLLDHQLEVNRLLLDDLNRNLEVLKAGMLYGVATQTDVDEVTVAILEAGQQQIGLQSGRVAYCTMLAWLTGMELNDDTHLTVPAAAIPQQWINRRPELALIDAGIALNNGRNRQLSAMNMPVLSAFVQGVYGRPGLNMLKNEFGPGFVGGIRINYNFGSLYTLKKDRLSLSAANEMLENRRETFLFDTDMRLIAQKQELKRVYDLMRQDDEIIRLRTDIVAAAEMKLKNGTILTSDLLRDISARNSAIQQKVMHDIESLQIIWKMKQLVNYE